MPTVTVHLSDAKYARLRQMAEQRGISMDQLIDELSTLALADFDAETRFLARTGLGSREEGLALLDLLARES